MCHVRQLRNVTCLCVRQPTHPNLRRRAYTKQHRQATPPAATWCVQLTRLTRRRHHHHHHRYLQLPNTGSPCLASSRHLRDASPYSSPAYKWTFFHLSCNSLVLCTALRYGCFEPRFLGWRGSGTGRRVGGRWGTLDLCGACTKDPAAITPSPVATRNTVCISSAAS